MVSSMRGSTDYRLFSVKMNREDFLEVVAFEGALKDRLIDL